MTLLEYAKRKEFQFSNNKWSAQGRISDAGCIGTESKVSWSIIGRNKDICYI